RGGEAAALLRLATRSVEGLADHVDLLVGIDWGSAPRFQTPNTLAPDGLIVSDRGAGAPPAGLRPARARLIDLPLAQLTKANPGWRANMIALGAAARLLGLDEAVLQQVIKQYFAAKGQDVVSANAAA